MTQEEFDELDQNDQVKILIRDACLIVADLYYGNVTAQKKKLTIILDKLEEVFDA